MDKRTLLAMLLIFVVFMLSQLLWKKAPQIEPKKSEFTKRQEKIESTKIKSEVPAQEEQKDKISPILSSTNISAKVVNDSIILENEHLKIIFTNKGGNIRQIYLKQYLDDDRKNYITLIPHKRDIFNIDFSIDESNLSLSSTVLDYEIEQGKKITFFLMNENQEQVFERTYVFTDDYKLSMDIKVDNLGYIKNYQINMASKVNVKPSKNKRLKDVMKSIIMINNEIEKDKLSKLSVEKVYNGNVNWATIKTKYFMIGLIPERKLDTEKIDIGIENNYVIQNLSIDVERVNIAHHYDLYLGPLIYERLKEYNNGIEETLEFGVFKSISRILLKFLLFLHKFIPNYGLAVIVFALVIKIVFYPLTHKSFESTKKMQEVQPLLREIQVRYKKNPKKLQQETMALYKEHKVSPVGGCLPMLLQMPILFALYPVLNTAIELRQAGFILWINDLSRPDPFLILPIAMCVTTFIQQKMSMATVSNVPVTDEKQKAQQSTQKMMMYIMPIFLFLIFKSMPAGLVLYWFTYNVLSIGQQYIINRKFATN